MKKISVIFLIIGVVAISAYVFVRHSLNTPQFDPPQTKNKSVQTKAPESFLDLKPKLIEKLQQLVKKGSDGLYNLFIHELKPDVLQSTLSLSNVLLVPDTAALEQLKQEKKLPDEIVRIKAASIWIDGLDLKDILSKDVIDVTTIHILQPTIEVYSQKKPSGKNENDSKTLYQRLMEQMKHIGIGKLIIEKGTLITHHEKKKPSRFNDVAIHLTNIVIDSTTQFDKNRFLFAKDAELTMKNYTVPTSNNLYTFKVGMFSVAANKKLLVASNIVLQPHFGKDEFQKHIPSQKERYEISIPSIVFKNTNWWNLINHEIVQAQYAEIDKASVYVYLDRRKPSGPTDLKGFPHQMLMQLPLKVNIAEMKVNDLDLTYEEFSKVSNQSGKLYVTNMHGTITNLTNLSEAIKRNKTITVAASATLMHVAPANLILYLDLSKYQTGSFSAVFKSTKNFDGTQFNSIAEPLGLFEVKRGEMKELAAHVSGDNYKASGDVLMLYDNLHITPLKKDEDKPGGLKKKSLTSLLANVIVLKNENPSKNGEVRKEEATFTRRSGTFFNLIWKTILVGMLETIGAPKKLAYQ